MVINKISNGRSVITRNSRDSVSLGVQQDSCPASGLRASTPAAHSCWFALLALHCNTSLFGNHHYRNRYPSTSITAKRSRRVLITITASFIMTTLPDPPTEEMAATTISEIVLGFDPSEAKEDPHPGSHHHHSHNRGESLHDFDLMGAEWKSQAAADKNATVSVLGEEGGELRKVIATEIVNNPVQLYQPPQVLQNSILLIDPKLPEVMFTIEAASRRNLMVTAVIPNTNDGTKNLNLHPTASRLLEAGVHQVYEPPLGAKFDVMEASYHLKVRW